MSLISHSLASILAQRQNSNCSKKHRSNYGPPARRGRGRGRGRGSSSPFSFNSSNRPHCQVCRKPGHTASKCYHRFDHSYQGDSHPPAAYLTSPSTSPDMNWYPDTGSTNHLTNDLTTLNVRSNEYSGNEVIRVGNGQGLKILHTGLANLPTPSRNFQLSSLLHVPEIQKNLISVYQFTHDNNVFIEFHPSCFRVKDIRTRRLLLQGRVGVAYFRGQ